MAYETAVAVIGVGGLFGTLILAVNTDGQKHPAPKLLYILISLWYVVGLLNLALQIATGDSAPDAVINGIVAMYRAMIFVALTMSFYYVIFFIKSVVDWASKVWEKRRNRNDLEM